LDNLVSKYVRLRDGRCVICGTKENLQCGHFEHRGNYALRWDLRNCNCQCSTCNGQHEYITTPYRRYMEIQYGEEIFDEFLELTISHREKGGWKIGELLLMEEEIKKLLKELS
jgi:hypothetical protein